MAETETNLPAELAEILGVLADLHLFDLLPQTGTISGTCRNNKWCTSSETWILRLMSKTIANEGFRLRNNRHSAHKQDYNENHIHEHQKRHQNTPYFPTIPAFLVRLVCQNKRTSNSTIKTNTYPNKQTIPGEFRHYTLQGLHSFSLGISTAILIEQWRRNEDKWHPNQTTTREEHYTPQDHKFPIPKKISTVTDASLV